MPPIKYTNRKGDDYYIKVTLSKKGNKRYYVVRNIEKYDASQLLHEIPEGFEFYELPYESKVVFRKIIKSKFSDAEKEVVSKIMDDLDSPYGYLLDLEEKTMTIYLGHLTREEMDWATDEQFRRIQSYNPKLGFQKEKETEKYQIFRTCAMPGYPEWIIMETHEDLKYLAEKYCPHIDKESLLKFWIEGEKDW